MASLSDLRRIVGILQVNIWARVTLNTIMSISCKTVLGIDSEENKRLMKLFRK